MTEHQAEVLCYKQLPSSYLLYTWHPDSILKSSHYFANEGPSGQGYGFSSGHVWMWELYYNESWALKNGCFWTVVLEKTLESPLDCKEIQPVHPKRDQSWVFIGRNNIEAETPILRPPDALELTHLKRPWCWERLRAGGEGDDRGWDGWMASPMQWTWVWANSGSWWWTGRPGVLQFMGSQSWTRLSNWTDCIYVSAALSIHPTLSLSPCAPVSNLHLCSFPGNRLICTVFIDSTYIS